MGTFSIEGKEPDKCENHVEAAASIVWELHNREKESEHARFDVWGEWVGAGAIRDSSSSGF